MLVEALVFNFDVKNAAYISWESMLTANNGHIFPSFHSHVGVISWKFCWNFCIHNIFLQWLSMKIKSLFLSWKYYCSSHKDTGWKSFILLQHIILMALTAVIASWQGCLLLYIHISKHKKVCIQGIFLVFCISSSVTWVYLVSV